MPHGLMPALLLQQARARAQAHVVVAVRADMQGLGLGSRLLVNVEGQLRTHGARSIILHARVSVEPFYQMLGYVSEGDDFVEVTLPHRCMRKQLGC